MSAYQDFTKRLKLLISKNPHLITTTSSRFMLAKTFIGPKNTRKT